MILSMNSLFLSLNSWLSTIENNRITLISINQSLYIYIYIAEYDNNYKNHNIKIILQPLFFFKGCMSTKNICLKWAENFLKMNSGNEKGW
jgi:hypothetical protein